MKKKIILALIACLFASGSIINMHLAQNDHNTDISLADISVMAQADGESGGGWCCWCHDGGGWSFGYMGGTTSGNCASYCNEAWQHITPHATGDWQCN